MATIRIPTFAGEYEDLSVTDNGDGTFTLDVVSVPTIGSESYIIVPLQGGGFAKLATYESGGVHTLAAMSAE